MRKKIITSIVLITANLIISLWINLILSIFVWLDWFWIRMIDTISFVIFLQIYVYLLNTYEIKKKIK